MPFLRDLPLKLDRQIPQKALQSAFLADLGREIVYISSSLIGAEYELPLSGFIPCASVHCFIQMSSLHVGKQTRYPEESSATAARPPC